jgi:type II secretory ATPase GspE/PulE/Tfp pilus assembly ATPase PilB-like protein
MTAAQKAAKANFKKAIEYRKKTGVSLKEAFAHVYGKKKVGAAPKKKGAKKAAKKAAPKKASKKVVKKAAKKAAPKKVARKVVKKAAPKRSVSLHKDTKSHNVNIRVMSGLKDVNSYLLDQLNATLTRIKNTEEAISKLRVGILKKQYTKDDMPEAKRRLKKYSEYLKELKKHFTEIKKQIK